MISILRESISKIRFLPNSKFEIARNICGSSCVRYAKSGSKSKAEQIAEKKQKEMEESNKRLSKLYHFTNMKYHAIVTRLKIYPLITTVFATPITYALEMAQILPGSAYIPCLAFGLTGTITLTAYSAALSNTIGIIYMCKENQNLQIAYIDFFGGQKFVDITVDELRKCEKSNIKFGLYKTVKVNYNKEEKLLKLPWNSGDIYDIKLYRRIFGK